MSMASLQSDFAKANANKVSFAREHHESKNENITPRITGTEYLVAQYNALTQEFGGNKRAVKDTMYSTKRQVIANEQQTIASAHSQWRQAKKAMELQRRLIHEKFEFLKKLMKRRYNELLRIREHLIKLERDDKIQVSKENDIKARQEQLNRDRANVEDSRRNLENEKMNLADEMNQLKEISQRMNKLNLDFTKGVNEDETLQELDRMLRELGERAYGIDVRLSQISSITDISELTGLGYHDMSKVKHNNYKHKFANKLDLQFRESLQELSREYYDNIYESDSGNEEMYNDHASYYKSSIRGRSRKRKNTPKYTYEQHTRSTSPLELNHHSSNNKHQSRLEMQVNKKIIRSPRDNINDQDYKIRKQLSKNNARSNKSPITRRRSKSWTKALASASFSKPRESSLRSNHNAHKQKRDKRVKNQNGGRLVIRLLEASRILGRHGKTANSFVELQLNDQIQYSKAVRSTDPNWNQTFVFQVNDYQKDKLILRLMDDKSVRGPDLIAEMVIPVSDFVEKHETERISTETIQIDNMEMHYDIAFEEHVATDSIEFQADFYDQQEPSKTRKSTSKSQSKSNSKKKRKSNVFADMLRKTFIGSKKSKKKTRRSKTTM